MSFTIVSAYEELDSVRVLFREYVDWLDMDLSFQGFEEELHILPGKYAAPEGRLYLAKSGETPAGCIALRRFDAQRCEMKRLYVRPAFRGQGLGQLLARRLLAEATEQGYETMLLDTMQGRMGAALGMYRRLGFREIAPYYVNPAADAVYLEKRLREPGL